MSADRLREAARVLREQAEVKPDRFIAAEEGSVATAKVVTYILTMHPGVGLALADWLDAHAATGESYRGPLPWLYDPEAVRLADLILGGAA